MSNILGTVNSDNLVGTDFADEIDGLAGSDVMVGGYGADTYYVDNVGDIVQDGVWQAESNSTVLSFQSDLDDGAIDTIVSSVNYTLSEGVENLLLTKTAISGTGNELDNQVSGNANNNILDGAAGDDLLNGFDGNDTLNGGLGNDTLIGNIGADTMTGGAGNDFYEVDNANDKVIEVSGGGADTILSTISYTLADNVEKLILDEKTTAIQATGNATANTLVGNTAANILDGGKGADLMIGGDGDDTYYVDSTSDSIKEYRNSGTDNVISSVSYTLSSDVENLTLSGTGSINGSGNAMNNIITGNDLKNTLNGGAGRDQLLGGGGNDILNGGLGDDLMNGGEGSDTFFVDSQGDTVVDNGTGAKDIECERP